MVVKIGHGRIKTPWWKRTGQKMRAHLGRRGDFVILQHRHRLGLGVCLWYGGLRLFCVGPSRPFLSSLSVQWLLCLTAGQERTNGMTKAGNAQSAPKTLTLSG